MYNIYAPTQLIILKFFNVTNNYDHTNVCVTKLHKKLHFYRTIAGQPSCPLNGVYIYYVMSCRYVYAR